MQRPIVVLIVASVLILLSGCTPTMTLTFLPDTLSVPVDSPGRYLSQPLIQCNGLGLLDLYRVEFSLRGESRLTEAAELISIGEGDWRFSPGPGGTRVTGRILREMVPVMLFADEYGRAYTVEVDNHNWTPLQRQTALHAERIELQMSFYDSKGNVIARSVLEIRFTHQGV